VFFGVLCEIAVLAAFSMIKIQVFACVLKTHRAGHMPPPPEGAPDCQVHSGPGRRARCTHQQLHHAKQRHKSHSTNCAAIGIGRPLSTSRKASGKTATHSFSRLV